MIISRTQRSTSREENWWRAHQSSFLTQTVYQSRAVGSNRMRLTSPAPRASAQCCSKLGIKGRVTCTQTQVFLTQHSLTTHGAFQFFSTFFTYTPGAPPDKMLPTPQSTDSKVHPPVFFPSRAAATLIPISLAFSAEMLSTQCSIHFYCVV